MRFAALIGLLLMLASVAGAQDNGLSLEEALALAGDQHPVLEAARLNVVAADEQAQQAGAWLNPGLFLKMEDAPREGDAWNGSNRILGLSQELPYSGRVGASRKVAEAQAGRVGHERDLMTNTVEAQVRAAFAFALHARDALTIREEGVAVAQRLYDLTNERVEAGDAPGVDRRRARMELGATEADLGVARIVEMDARVKLATAMGVDVETVTAVLGELESDAVVPDLDQLLTAMDAAPRNRISGATVDVGAARVTEASRLRYPDLELEAGLRTAPGGDSFDAGVKIAVPIFDRGGARLSAARAEAAAAEWNAQSSRREFEAAVRRAHAELAVAVESAALYQDIVVPEATAALRAAEAAYTAGDTDLTGILQITRDWLDARMLRLDLLLVEAQARSKLIELL